MRWFSLFLVLAGGGLLGCSQGEPAATSEGGENAAPIATASGLKSYAAIDLPEVEEAALPTMDQGRIQIRLPAGWKTLARSKNFLVACVPAEIAANKLPRITVSATDPPGETETTNADNAGALAARLQNLIVKEGKKPIESCRPIMLGDTVWIRHVRRAALGDDAVAIQSLQTVASGRLYTVELTVTAKDNPRKSNDLIYQDSLKAHRDYGYAVAANTRFPKEAGNAPELEQPAEEKQAEKPAAKPDKKTEKKTEKK